MQPIRFSTETPKAAYSTFFAQNGSRARDVEQIKHILERLGSDALMLEGPFADPHGEIGRIADRMKRLRSWPTIKTAPNLTNLVCLALTDPGFWIDLGMPPLTVAKTSSLLETSAAEVASFGVSQHSPHPVTIVQLGLLAAAVMRHLRKPCLMGFMHFHDLSGKPIGMVRYLQSFSKSPKDQYIINAPDAVIEFVSDRALLAYLLLQNVELFIRRLLIPDLTSETPRVTLSLDAARLGHTLFNGLRMWPEAQSISDATEYVSIFGLPQNKLQLRSVRGLYIDHLLNLLRFGNFPEAENLSPGERTILSWFLGEVRSHIHPSISCSAHSLD
ncbi:hypothetical protein HYT84_02480 [Candidatus Micrarchaeota archaeon]|nr:hypothetical protein [Candidatus Micrarchaeota archaeon]